MNALKRTEHNYINVLVTARQVFSAVEAARSRSKLGVVRLAVCQYLTSPICAIPSTA